jgi:hypothetical protein
MKIAAEIGIIEKIGPDYIWWRNGSDRSQVNFGDLRNMTKEDCAASLVGLVGRPAVMPVSGPPFIAVDFLPGDFEGTMKVLPANFSIASVERL